MPVPFLDAAAGERAPRGEGGGSRWGAAGGDYKRLGGVAKATERQAGPAPAGLGKGLDRGYIITVLARPFAVMTGNYEGRILYSAKLSTRRFLVLYADSVSKRVSARVAG